MRKMNSRVTHAAIMASRYYLFIPSLVPLILVYGKSGKNNFLTLSIHSHITNIIKRLSLIF